MQNPVPIKTESSKVLSIYNASWGRKKNHYRKDRKVQYTRKPSHLGNWKEKQAFQCRLD